MLGLAFFVAVARVCKEKRHVRNMRPPHAPLGDMTILLSCQPRIAALTRCTVLDPALVQIAVPDRLRWRAELAVVVDGHGEGGRGAVRGSGILSEIRKS